MHKFTCQIVFGMHFDSSLDFSSDIFSYPSVFRHAHPGSPYVFGLVGDNHDLDFPDPMPVVGKSQGDLMKDPFPVNTC